jgi:hypothetical protein
MFEDGKIRTYNQWIKSPLLYPLSYTPFLNIKKQVLYKLLLQHSRNFHSNFILSYTL